MTLPVCLCQLIASAGEFDVKNRLTIGTSFDEGGSRDLMVFGQSIRGDEHV